MKFLQIKKLTFAIIVFLFFALPVNVFAADCCVYYVNGGDGPVLPNAISGAWDLPAAFTSCPIAPGYLAVPKPSSSEECTKGKGMMSSASQEILKAINDATNKIVPKSSGTGGGATGAGVNLLGDENAKGLKELNQVGVTSVPKLIGKIIKAAMGIMGSISLAMFVYAGFLWMVSGASGDKNKKAKDIFVWATLGIVVIFSSYAIVEVVFDLF